MHDLLCWWTRIPYKGLIFLKCTLHFFSKLGWGIQFWTQRHYYNQGYLSIFVGQNNPWQSIFLRNTGWRHGSQHCFWPLGEGSPHHSVSWSASPAAYAPSLAYQCWWPICKSPTAPCWVSNLWIWHYQDCILWWPHPLPCCDESHRLWWPLFLSPLAVPSLSVTHGFLSMAIVLLPLLVEHLLAPTTSTSASWWRQVHKASAPGFAFFCVSFVLATVYY